VLRRLLLRLRTRGHVRLGRDVAIGRGVTFDLGPAARVVLADGCAIGDGTRFHVAAGEVVVGARARLGERCRLTALERIEVGARARLAGEVMLIDFDHVTSDVERPIRHQGLVSAPVLIGEDAVLDDHATVLRGVTVGPGAHVTTRAVVTRDVPAGATVGGVPAKA
jgi:acetyltransferase-like isoleucine patch superfamily enzyme